MCENLEKTTLKTFVGFKVVGKHKKTGKYFSVFTGKPYPENGRIPKWITQKPLSGHFNSFILPGSRKKHREFMKKSINHGGWVSNLIGRTSAFKEYVDADYLCNKINTHSNTEKDFDFIIVKIKLTDGLMTGTYGDSKVMVGRHMEIIKEMA